MNIFTKSMIVTNNPLVNDKYRETKKVIFLDGMTYMDVLEKTRDLVYEGHELLTHPLSGSVKPNETPFKSILVSEQIYDLDENGVQIIGNSVETVKKFLEIEELPEWTERVLDDFRVVDLSLMEHTIDKLGH